MLLTVFTFLLAAVFAVEGQSGAIALYNNGDTSTSNTAGIVRVYYNGQWGNICDDSTFGPYFSFFEADVVCQQLGYSGASSYSTARQESYGTDTSPTVLTDVDCASSSYLVLLRCDYESYYGGCNNNDDITVDCYSTPIWDSSPFSGMVRLQDGELSNEGRIEVYCNGEWGTVCDDSGYTQYTGDTVCKQLGYTKAYSLTTNAADNTTLPTWLDSVDCSSGDSCLANCQRCPSSSTSCSDGDAGVTCEYSTSDDNYYNTLNTCILSNLSTGTIIGIVIGSIVLCLFCTALFIFVPVCICCCLGIGIGAASRRTGNNINTRYETM